MGGYWLKPQWHGKLNGWAALGPFQANWGTRRGSMPRGIRVFVTWPSTHRITLL